MMKDDSVYIDHIKECTEKIISYTNGVGKADFMDNVMLQDAVIRNFEIIGEAAAKISEKYKNEKPDIPWRKLVGLRNILIHHYTGVDL